MTQRLGTNRLQDNSVSTTKIADDSINSDKIINGAITTIKIADQAIDGQKLQLAVVDTKHLAPLSVKGNVIAINAISSNNIVDGAITAEKIAPGAGGNPAAFDTANAAFIHANAAFDTANTAAGFPNGTTMLFVQTTAPTGWTKSTTHNNKALRVVSGAASSGGNTAFTSVFTSRTPAGTVSGNNSGGAVQSTTLTEAQSGVPAHSHTITDPGHTHRQTTSSTDGASGRADASSGGTIYNNIANITSNTTGISINNNTAQDAASGHDHGFTQPSWSGSFSGNAMDFAVQYVDAIIATKD
jgi:hypothetical protein